MDRDFDVIAFGATGYVGHLIAEELLRAAPDPSRVAIAGRDERKLRAVAEDLGRPELPLVIADAHDEATLAAMAQRTRVLISTVGPYLKYGMATVRACAQHGTHYVDLNGEVLFARDVIDALDGVAKESGSTLVTACGFDSVPSDLGVLLAADAAAAADAGELLTTVCHVRDLVGGLSGGTVDALRTQIDQGRTAARTPERSASDPYALSPDRDAEPEPRGRRGGVTWLESSADTGEFAGPFIMSSYNEQIVRRSNALLGWRYGRGFRYREVRDSGRGALGLLRGIGTAATFPAFLAVLTTPGLRQVADRLLPAPGEGPSEKARAKGRFRIEVHAETTAGKRVIATVADDRDPGYGSTAVMISQAALALAAGEGLATGVTTPAAGLGQGYAQRLRDRGLTLAAHLAD